jgi:two-component system response regulator FixJ
MVYLHKQSPSERDAIGEVLGWASVDAREVETCADLVNRLDRAKPSCVITDLPTTTATHRKLNGLPLEELETVVEPGGGAGDSHTLVICAACLAEAGYSFRDACVSFLKRPYTRGQLLEAVQKALACDEARKERSRQFIQLRERIGTLTPREHQVMDLIYEGLPNKTIAGQLGLSTRTVEAARAAVYRKLGVDSGIALVRLLARMEYEVAPRG